jgi:hypothetical protein
MVLEGARMPLVPSRFTLCCVIDENPRLYVELVLWTICVKRYLPPDRFRIIVYFLGAAPPDLVDWVGAADIEMRCAETVVEGAPHCNKIAPFFDRHRADCTIVCDSDLFFV